MEEAVSPARQSRPKRRGRILGLVIWIFPLIAALGFVVWRQSAGVALEQEIRGIRAEHAIAEAERLELVRRIQALSSRARIVRVARERLGMHLPSDAEILLLPAPTTTADSVREGG
jgi:cell division protein FtsL